ncbi:MAG: two-component system response regulator NarL [Pseudomonadota bacterium]
MTPSTSATISVVIVDDHPLFRRGLIQLLNTIPQFHLVGESSGGQAGIELVRRLHPDLLLLDLNMKGMDGLEVLKVVKRADLDTRVIMVTVSDQAEDLVTALRHGADGYLLKDMEPEQMVESLQAAAAGQVIISDALTHLLAAALRGHKRPQSAQEADLTDQEARILERIAVGMSNKVIGKELDIAEGTVKVHVKHILRKLGLKSRVEAAVWAVANLPPSRQRQGGG